MGTMGFQIQSGGCSARGWRALKWALDASPAFLSPGQACRYGHVQHLEHLLFYGADMTAQNASGNTALHVCALYNQVSPPPPHTSCSALALPHRGTQAPPGVKGAEQGRPLGGGSAFWACWMRGSSPHPKKA